MSTVRMSTLAALVAGSLALSAVQRPSDATGQSIAPPAPPAPAGQVNGTDWVFTPAAAQNLLGWGQAQHTSIQLAQKYAKTEKEEEKRDIRKQLIDVLNKQFDEHAEQQKKELEELERQIEQLRKTLQKRQDVKDKIVERRFEQLVQDAEGLGWSAPNTPSAGYRFGVGPIPQPRVIKDTLKK